MRARSGRDSAADRAPHGHRAGICDRMLVLSYGEQIADGTPREACPIRKVIKAYLGGRAPCGMKAGHDAQGDPERPEAVPRVNAGLDAGTLLPLLAANARMPRQRVAMREKRSRHLAGDHLGWQCSTRCSLLPPALDGTRALPRAKVCWSSATTARAFTSACCRGGALAAYRCRSTPRCRPTNLSFTRASRRGRASCWPKTRSRSTRCSSCASARACSEHIVYDDPRGLAHYARPGLVAWDASCTRGARRLKRRAAPARRSASRAASHGCRPCCIHSSGTTGKPKGVVLQHRHVISAARNA